MRTTTPAIDTAAHLPQPAGRERDAAGEGEGVFPSSARYMYFCVYTHQTLDRWCEYKDGWVGAGAGRGCLGGEGEG